MVATDSFVFRGSKGIGFDLEVAGGSVSYLGVAGGSLSYLEVAGGSVSYLEVAGGSVSYCACEYILQCAS